MNTKVLNNMIRDQTYNRRSEHGKQLNQKTYKRMKFSHHCCCRLIRSFYFGAIILRNKCK